MSVPDCQIEDEREFEDAVYEGEPSPSWYADRAIELEIDEHKEATHHHNRRGY